MVRLLPLARNSEYDRDLPVCRLDCRVAAGEAVCSEGDSKSCVGSPWSELSSDDVPNPDGRLFKPFDGVEGVYVVAIW